MFVQDLFVLLLALAEVAGRSIHHIILQLFEALVLRVNDSLLVLVVIYISTNHALHLFELVLVEVNSNIVDVERTR